MISFFIFGCKTKKILKTQSKEKEKVTENLKSEEVQKEENKSSKSSGEKTIEKSEKKEDKKEIEISGKVDKENPVTFYNVVNGDTIDLFKITGNADFVFKSSNNDQKSTQIKELNKESSREKKGLKSISNAVENVKEKAKEVQQKTVDVVKKDFTFETYVVFLIWGIVIIGLFFLILWIRKTNLFKSIIETFKKLL